MKIRMPLAALEGTIEPITSIVAAHVTTPEFIRLPTPGSREPYTGLTRSFLNLLILPCDYNNHKPPVRSFVLRKKGAKTGVRLIDAADLFRYIREHPESNGKDAA